MHILSLRRALLIAKPGRALRRRTAPGRNVEQDFQESHRKNELRGVQEVRRCAPDAEVPELQLEVIGDSAGFDALEKAWSRLVQGAGVSIFQTYEWQRAWWHHFGEQSGPAVLHIVVVRNSDRIIAIAPFFIERVQELGFIHYSRLAFIATGPSDYLDVIIEQGYEQVCLEMIGEHLTAIANRFDVVDLQDIPDRAPTHSLLHTILQQQGFRGKCFVNEYCPRVTLAGTWEETLANFKSRYRREIQRRQKNIHKSFDVEFEVLKQGDESADAIDELMMMHQAKWLADGHPGVFADSQIAEFHRDIVRRFAARKWLFLAFMNINGSRAAGLYCFVFRDEMSGYLSANPHRSDLTKFAPGRALNAFCMQEAVTMGKKVYDFLRGTEPYKYELGAQDVPNWSILAYSPRALLPEVRHKSALLVLSARRRWRRETIGIRASMNDHGIFSFAMVKYLMSRLKENMAEGFLKARAPERATNVRPKLHDDSQNGADKSAEL